MAKSIQRIEESLAQMKSLGSKLSKLFTFLFAGICVTLAILLVVEAYRFVSMSAIPDAYSVLQFASSSIDYVIYGAMLLIMRSVANDVAGGRPPFTIAHANQIKAIAWMFVVGLLLGIIVSPGFAEVAQVGGFDLGLTAGRIGRYPVVQIDVKSIVSAIVCFSLSSVWKYGALLQADSDDYL